MRFSEGGPNRTLSAGTDRGFSLIELLIVIGILGVLAGIVAFAVGGFSDAGEEESCKTERKTLITALEAFKSKEWDDTAAGTATYKGYPSDPVALEQAQLILDTPTKWTYTEDNQVAIAAPGTIDIVVDGSPTGDTTTLFNDYRIVHNQGLCDAFQTPGYTP